MADTESNILVPGTKIKVGDHEITVIKHFSKGGLSNIYTCYTNPTHNNKNIACLKQIVVHNKWNLNLLRHEVDCMKQLNGNKHIVSYIDSHAMRINNTTKQGQQQKYQVLILLEYCENHGLLDYMNKKISKGLQEKEILQIMHDVTIGVAMCHHLNPPLMHRDIKVENILVDSNQTFKLCDFGSAVEYHPSPVTYQEVQWLKNDIINHTTPQYCSPEMINFKKGYPINDKSDVWALGCLLYKLCYYTTPFEDPNTSHDELSFRIMNPSIHLKFKDRPGCVFSQRLKNIVICCLNENPQKRPSAVLVLNEICLMLSITKIPNYIPIKILKNDSKINEYLTKKLKKINIESKTSINLNKHTIEESQKIDDDPYSIINCYNFLDLQNLSNLKKKKIRSDDWHFNSFVIDNCNEGKMYQNKIDFKNPLYEYISTSSSSDYKNMITSMKYDNKNFPEISSKKTNELKTEIFFDSDSFKNEEKKKKNLTSSKINNINIFDENSKSFKKKNTNKSFSIKQPTTIIPNENTIVLSDKICGEISTLKNSSDIEFDFTYKNIITKNDKNDLFINNKNNGALVLHPLNIKKHVKKAPSKPIKPQNLKSKKVEKKSLNDISHLNIFNDLDSIEKSFLERFPEI